jgi:hypothetical protein
MASTSRDIFARFRDMAIRYCTEKFVSFAVDFLRGEPINDSAYCYRCKKQCKVTKGPSDSGELSMWVGGNTCTPWSSSGDRLGWLDPCSIVNMIYLHFLNVTSPDFVINECTPFYDVKVMETFLTSHDPFHIHFGPTDLGLPVSRDRVYSILGKKVVVKSIVPWSTELFKSTFGRQCVRDGQMCMISTEQQRKEFMDRLAAKRHILPRSDGRPWSGRLIMPPGHRYRLEQVMDDMVRKGEAFAFVDVTQSLRFRRASNLVPCLMTRSWIYCIPTDTFLTPTDLLAAQCLPFGLPLDHPLRRFAAYGDDIFKGMSDKEMMLALGNGMVLPCVGTIILAALASFVPV